MNTSGTVTLDSVYYKVDVNLAFQQVLVVSTGNDTGDTIIITDLASIFRAGGVPRCCAAEIVER